jgi:peroxiredoxin
LNLPFPLGSDPKGEMAEAYGVKNGSHASRATFVIDGAGKIVSVVEGNDALDPDPALQACPLHKPKT